MFGSKCYAYKSEGFSKLEPRCEEGIFVGYDEESPSFLVYFPNTQKVKKERQVKFTTNAPEVSVQESSPSDVFVVPPVRTLGG